MARSKRFLILLAVLAAACAAAAIALNWQQRQEQIQTSGEAVLEIDPDSVQALSWTRGELSLSFTRDEEGNWSYDDDDAFPVDPEAMEQLLSPFAPFSAAFVIEEAQDEGQYGLDEPECSISIDTGETSYEILLGDTSAVDGQRYVSFGDGKVYLADDARYTPEYRELYQRRKETIERVFADAKEKHAMRYTQYRGLAQVSNWVKLKFAAMNLKKLARWLCQESLASLCILLLWPLHDPNSAYA